MLKEYIKDLEARLAKYENAHTPPSLRRGRNRTRDQKNRDQGKPGQKIGHEGVTRPQAKPNRQVEVTADRCPDCGAELGIPIRIESKIIEEIPDPQPIIVIEYRIAHYSCPCCHREVVAKDSDCPSEGRFGNNTITQTTLLKYEDRLPHRKIREALRRMHGLDISCCNLDLTRRAADAVQSQYDAILDRVREAPVLYVDETSIAVQGKLHWIWTFASPSETFFAIRKSRGTKVLSEVLTERFLRGIIVCDGWRSYPKFTEDLQRCWRICFENRRILQRRLRKQFRYIMLSKNSMKNSKASWTAIRHQKYEGRYGTLRWQFFNTGLRKNTPAIK